MKAKIAVLVYLGAACGLWLCSCTSAEPNSPRAVVEAFAQALERGDTSAAADLMAWEEIARSQNSDWDSIPASQRNLIIKRLKEQKKEWLGSLGRLLAGGSVKQVREGSGSAFVTVASPQGTAVFSLVLSEDTKWRVLSVQQAPPGTPVM